MFLSEGMFKALNCDALFPKNQEAIVLEHSERVADIGFYEWVAVFFEPMLYLLMTVGWLVLMCFYARRGAWMAAFIFYLLGGSVLPYAVGVFFGLYPGIISSSPYLAVAMNEMGLSYYHGTCDLLGAYVMPWGLLMTILGGTNLL